MKLVVAGSTGFVVTELIRQALSNPAVTSIVGLARRTTPVPANTKPGADSAKLKSVICDNFESYSDDVKKELAGADACIWLIAVTPSQLKKMSGEETRKICLDYMMTGLETTSQLPRSSDAKPFRFVYISGAKTERDQTKKPWMMPEFLLMRGECEHQILEYTRNSQGAVESVIFKSGLIEEPGEKGFLMQLITTIGRTVIGLPKIDVGEISAALLDQAVNGIKKDTLMNLRLSVHLLTQLVSPLQHR